MNANPWERWGIIYSTRDGLPVLAEAALWQLTGSHPEAVERVGEKEMYLHLDRAYRVVKLQDRAFVELEPVERPPR